MKIAHLTPVFPPYESGVSSVCFGEVKELAKLGHKITVFTPFYHECLKLKDLLFRVKYLKPVFEYGNAAFVPQIGNQLRKFDLIHLHYPFCGAVESLLFFRKIFKRQPPLVLTYHNDLRAEGLKGKIFEVYNRFFLRRIIKEALRVLLSSFDFISGSQLKDLFPLYRQKLIELPLGVDTQVFMPRAKRKDLVEKYEIKENDIALLFIGGLDKPHFYKGLEVVLGAMARLRQSFPNLKLLVIGEGELKNAYINLAENLRLSSRVVFLGQILHKDLSSYYNLADIFVFPSRQPETFGLVVLEAMACSKPIIASNWPVLRNLVQPEINGFLFQPGNVQDLTAQIIKFLKKPELIQKFGQNSRQMVHDGFSWQSHVKKLISIYEELLNLSK